MVSEAAVRRVIGVEGAEILVNIIEGAWGDYVAEGVTRYHRSTRANVVWDYMAKRCDDMLPEMEGVHRTERHGRPLFVLRERFIVRPKMHTDANTRNNPTVAQIAVQTLGHFPDLSHAVVSFGYELDKAGAGISDYIVTSPVAPWVINLEELATGQLNPVTPMLPGFEEEDLDAIVPIHRRQAN
jgi:hypothetical protein